MNPKETNNELLILNAAEEEFFQKGYDNARTTEIAKRAGVTHAMLHYYYRTKENLFETIFQRKIETLANFVVLNFDLDLPFFEKLRTGIANHFDLIAERPQLPNFIVNEILNHEGRRKRLLDVIKPKALKILRIFKKEMEIEAAKGTIKPIEPYDLLLNIISMNAFVFMASPVITSILNVGDEGYKEFLEHRKQVNIDLIISQLTK